MAKQRMNLFFIDFLLEMHESKDFIFPFSSPEQRKRPYRGTLKGAIPRCLQQEPIPPSATTARPE
jgi:hypothetical protein